MTSQFIAAAASVALVGAGFASVEGTRSSDVLPMHKVSLLADSDGSGGKCRVDVVRSGVVGTVDITRRVENDKTCVCTVTTGNASGSGAAENIVTNLLRDRTCDGAPAPGEAGTGASFAPLGAGLLPVLGLTGSAAAAATALESDSKG